MAIKIPIQDLDNGDCFVFEKGIICHPLYIDDFMSSDTFLWALAVWEFCMFMQSSYKNSKQNSISI